MPERRFFRSRSARVSVAASWLMKLALALILIYSFFIADYLLLFTCIIGLALSLSPSILERRFSITLPWEFDFLITVALFLHIIGDPLVFNTYYAIPYWDRLTHLVSASTIALFGFIAVAVVDGYRRDIRFTTPLLAFFTVIFTLAMGAIWEMFEFMLDTLFGTNEQWSNGDTMADLIFDLIGGLIIAIPGALYLQSMPPERFGLDFGREIGLDPYMAYRARKKKKN